MNDSWRSLTHIMARIPQLGAVHVQQAIEIINVNYLLKVYNVLVTVGDLTAAKASCHT